jgi:HD-GYP domain-containing protein (c-di-GMP phosphodiesterase class II)
VLLERRPSLDIEAGTPTAHFYIVSVVALLALVFAVAVIWAARRLPDPRTFFLAMGFLSMATIFVAHGLGTSPLFPTHYHTAPSASELAEQNAYLVYGAGGVTGAPVGGDDHAGHIAPSTTAPLVPDDTTIDRGIVVGYSAQLSLFVSSIFFALSVLSYGAGITRVILRFSRVLMGAFTAVLAGHVWVALADPSLLSWLPIGSDTARYTIGGFAILCFLFAGYRFYEAYRLALLPLQGAMALGMGLLIEAQIFMVRGQLWHLSWWEYHVVMLAGFGLCVAALLQQYRRTGDLGAVVEGLFLRQQVAGIRAGDPQAIVALTAAVAAKDTETAEHIGRVGDLVVAIGRRLGLAEERIEALHWAGRLHDVGKIGVPNSILRKPASLTPAEFDVIKLHSPRGSEIALRSEMLARIAPIVRAHHERLDGKGYPDGLEGDEIPLEARIVAVADVWDALTCDRPYRKAMTEQEAAAILRRDAGKHLDPVCIEALFAVIGFEQDRPLARAA